MACFIVPMVLGIITLIIQKVAPGLAKRARLGALNALLWGGVILLAFEHIWHGEVVPWPPFLTAMANPSDIPAMLHEMATIGTAMSVAVALTWSSMLAIAHVMSRALAMKESILTAVGPARAPSTR